MAPFLTLRPTYIHLKRQKYLCKSCHSIFVAQTDFVWEYCQISQPVRQMILTEAAHNSSLKDIARRFNVSDRTVQRVIDIEAEKHFDHSTEFLPRHIAFDKFKSTNKMSFIWCDSDTKRLGEILEKRTSYQIQKYFERFPLKVRRRVRTVTLDLNAGHINLVPKLFPKAKIVADRSHIVQMISRSLNAKRIQVMKTQPKLSRTYRFMKRAWKLFLKPWEKIEQKEVVYQRSVGYNETELNLITMCLDLDESFKKTYETYQSALKAIKTGNAMELNKVIDSYKKLDNPMDTTFKTFKKHRGPVLNVLKYSYSNGVVEGMIGRIKKIKNSAYGYKNLGNFITRIKLQMVWIPANA